MSHHVRLPSGSVLDLDRVCFLAVDSKGRAHVFESALDAWKFTDDDASALRAWAATLPRLRTEAEVQSDDEVDVGHGRGIPF
jgi:hypothetical protein